LAPGGTNGLVITHPKSGRIVTQLLLWWKFVQLWNYPLSSHTLMATPWGNPLPSHPTLSWQHLGATHFFHLIPNSQWQHLGATHFCSELCSQAYPVFPTIDSHHKVEGVDQQLPNLRGGKKSLSKCLNKTSKVVI
jgi:hypothetical protein